MSRDDKEQPAPGWRNRITGHGEEAPDQLLANPRNCRAHPKAQQDALAAVLDQVGWVQDVIVNQRTRHVVDGHARIALARSLADVNGRLSEWSGTGRKRHKTVRPQVFHPEKCSGFAILRLRLCMPADVLYASRRFAFHSEPPRKVDRQ